MSMIRRLRPLVGSALITILNCQIAAAQPLTLSDALSRSAIFDPAAKASAARLEAAEAGIRQADVGPRPVIGAELEDIAGTGAYAPVDRAQSTIYYERTWERGGKREARTNAARADLATVRKRAELRKLDTLAAVQAAWVDAQAAQAAVAVAEERLALAVRLQGEVSKRVNRALDPLFAGERAYTAVAQARIDRDQALENARIARATLASWWGGTDPFEIDITAFAKTDARQPNAVERPDIRLLATERDAADARVRLEQARSVTDPTIRAGVRHFRDGGDVALVLGGSIPLGGRDANRGNIEKARAERLAAEAEIAVAQAERDREIARLEASRAAIAEEVRRIGAEVLPRAERALALARDGFNRGGTAFTFLEVTEAQRGVIDVRARRIELLHRFHLNGVRLDRLNGRHLPLIASAENR